MSDVFAKAGVARMKVLEEPTAQRVITPRKCLAASDHAVIYVAALTYRRPGTLGQLLEAWRTLDLPDNSEVRFMIVDNDPGESGRPVAESFMPRFGDGRLVYVVEPEPGIPAARNRALQKAIDHGGDLLCFIDDDAYPDRAWLRELVACHRKTGATLVGGPLRFVPPAKPERLWTRLLVRSIVARAAFVERYAAKAGRKGQVITGGTGNWLGDLEWIRRHGLRFDAAMRDSGGEDASFRKAVQERGGQLAWSEQAVIYEHLPVERICLSYQFRRARSHGIIAARLQRRAPVAILRHPAGRIFVGVGLILAPILGAASFMLGLHMIGMGIGILEASRGAKSTLYQR